MTRLVEDMEKRELLCIVGRECKVAQPLPKAVWSFLKKLKIELPYDPAIPLLGIQPKETISVSQRHICTPMFIEALFTIAKTWKHPKCHQWMNG